MEGINFIKQIITQDTVDKFNHTQFIRFGKGSYEGRGYYKIKNSANLQLWCGFEFVSDIIRVIINTNDEMQVTGKVYAKKQISKPYLANEEKKKGFYVYVINDHFTKEQAEDFYETCKDAYILAKVSAKHVELKVNATPHNPRGKYKEKFCTCKAQGPTKDALLEEFAWDNKDFKVLEAKHTMQITEIKVPKDCENDPAKARLEAKRVGTMQRVLNIDGTESINEHAFEG